MALENVGHRPNDSGEQSLKLQPELRAINAEIRAQAADALTTARSELARMIGEGGPSSQRDRVGSGTDLRATPMTDAELASMAKAWFLERYIPLRDNTTRTATLEQLPDAILPLLERFIAAQTPSSGTKDRIVSASDMARTATKLTLALKKDVGELMGEDQQRQARISRHLREVVDYQITTDSKKEVSLAFERLNKLLGKLKVSAPEMAQRQKILLSLFPTINDFKGIISRLEKLAPESAEYKAAVATEIEQLMSILLPKLYLLAATNSTGKKLLEDNGKGYSVSQYIESIAKHLALAIFHAPKTDELDIIEIPEASDEEPKPRQIRSHLRAPTMTGPVYTPPIPPEALKTGNAHNKKVDRAATISGPIYKAPPPLPPEALKQQGRLQPTQKLPTYQAIVAQAGHLTNTPIIRATPPALGRTPVKRNRSAIAATAVAAAAAFAAIGRTPHSTPSQAAEHSTVTRPIQSLAPTPPPSTPDMAFTPENSPSSSTFPEVAFNSPIAMELRKSLEARAAEEYLAHWIDPNRPDRLRLRESIRLLRDGVIHKMLAEHPRIANLHSSRNGHPLTLKIEHTDTPGVFFIKVKDMSNNSEVFSEEVVINVSPTELVAQRMRFEANQAAQQRARQPNIDLFR
ncbi:MAG: hypothetical protein HY817_04140 [Candidatus Abawacabacteria bacterium]|nr:hypothetical protein [Candidatus Abawacabacteria bacterium]